MSLFDNESKQRRNKQIQLQNIILDIDEKKLQVSEEFLEQMTKIYISRYLKVINENISSINKVTNIALLFKKYDNAMKNIDELIKIEDLHRFRHPTPSEYKEMIEERLDKFIMSLISREWRKIAPQNSAETTDPILEKKWKAFFASFEPFEDRLTDNAKDTLEQLKNGVFPPEPPEEEQEDLHLVSEDDFIPEEFEAVDAPDAENKEENAAPAQNT